MGESRIKNSINNFKFGAIVQILNTLINFVVRTVFIKILGAEYLGIDGLFTNILTVLSFAELGIGNAIIYSMYKPVAEDDREKIKGLMKLYQKAYTIIGLTVLGIGICVVPFLNFMIKDTPNISENLILVYLLFLINTSLSYFCTYKKSIIFAHQKEYIVNKYKLFFYMLKSFLQISFLLITHNFIIYLIIQILCTFIENIYVSGRANKMYTYLKNSDVTPINKEEKNNIFKNVKSLVMYKFGSVILNGTDNIIISKMIGVVTVGICSNYTMIVTAVTSIIAHALGGFTASVGNLNAIGTKKQKEKVFYDLFFITVLIYGFCGGALFVLINPFIKIWVGKEYLLSIGVVISIILHFYINGLQFASFTYRNTMGLFNKGKYSPIIAALINIALSIIMGKYMGLMGIFLATSISRLLTTTWVDPYLICKYKIDGKLITYFKKYILYSLVVVFNILVCHVVLNFIEDTGIFTLIIKAILYTIITIIIYTLIFHRTEELKDLIERVKNMMARRKKDVLS